MILVPAWRAELRRGINEQTNDSLKLKQITEKSSKLKRQKPHGGVPSRALEDMELIKHILCLCWCRNITFYNFNIIYIQPVTWKHNQTLMRSQTKKASSSTRRGSIPRVIMKISSLNKSSRKSPFAFFSHHYQHQTDWN